MGNEAEEALSREITLRRAEVLREIAEGYSEREIAVRLGISPTGVRSHVEDLRRLTGCASMREMGRWWREKRAEWVDFVRFLAGAP